MKLFHKDFSSEHLQNEDFFDVLGIDEEEAKRESAAEADDKTILINRSKAKALLLAEELGAEITLEEKDGEIRIVISKKI